jgi:hypothetical protein
LAAVRLSEAQEERPPEKRGFQEYGKNSGKSLFRPSLIEDFQWRLCGIHRRGRTGIWTTGADEFGFDGSRFGIEGSLVQIQSKHRKSRAARNERPFLFFLRLHLLWHPIKRRLEIGRDVGW